MIIISIAYVVACFLIAVLGINKKFGFWGYFFGSLLLSPLIGVILLLASDKKKTENIQ